MRRGSFLLLLLAAAPAWAEGPADGPELEGFDYAYPVRRFELESQRQTLHMSYLDVRPQRPNGRTVVLLHGKNFYAGTWEATIRVLGETGYRVVAPDQIGFCKSTKPERYQYSFQQLAANTHALLEHLGVKRIVLVGHSTGGMLAARYVLLYPGEVEQVVLVNPIGLEDWKSLGVPWRSVDAWYAREMQTTAESIRQYEQATLVEFPELGHAPQIQDPAQFHQALLKGIR